MVYSADNFESLRTTLEQASKIVTVINKLIFIN